MKIPVVTALLFTTAAALAQPAAQTEFETVYSDAQRERDQDLSRRFVQGVLAPSTSFEDQYSKWNRPICPNVYGMSAMAKFMIEQRIRDVAHQVGAPIDRRDPCTPNITVVVTPEPQASLDSIAQAAPYLVVGGKKRQLTVTQPIQAWYTNFRRDYAGLAQLDLAWEDAATASPSDMTPLRSSPPRVNAQGGRLSTGVSSEMAGVVIIVDAKAIMGMTLGTLSDYFSLLALAPSPVTGKCQEVPSITNLMANCNADIKSASLSNVDLALLIGLYQTPEKPEMIQKQRIIGAMRRSLEAQLAH
jgi:hypothetical protein